MITYFTFLINIIISVKKKVTLLMNAKMPCPVVITGFVVFCCTVAQETRTCFCFQGTRALLYICK